MAGDEGVNKDYNLYMSENGHLSFQNPNYHQSHLGLVGDQPFARIDAARMEDHLNSNVVADPEVMQLESDRIQLAMSSASEGLTDLESTGLLGDIRKLTTHDPPTDGTKKHNSISRKGYASLDVGMMGVGQCPVTALDSNKLEEEAEVEKDTIEEISDGKNHSDICGEKNITEKGEVESDKLRVIEKDETEKERTSELEEEDFDGSGGEVVKRRRPKPAAKSLPPGWEKHTDEGGDYYWHVKSGTIQRQRPDINPGGGLTEEEEKAIRKKRIQEVRSSMIIDDDFDPFKAASATASAQPHTSDRDQTTSQHKMTKSSTSASIMEISSVSAKSTASSTRSTVTHGGLDGSPAVQKRRSLPPQNSQASASPSNEEKQTSMRVTVRSLGWIELQEESLTSENSSKAVNRCIVQLSSAADSTEILDSINGGVRENLLAGGNDLWMELDGEGHLRLIDPESGSVHTCQPIHTIRVWGVGRDNGRDFAYVARDKETRKHRCHVFRCDVPARAVANALRDICKKILIERSLAQSSSKLIGASAAAGSSFDQSSVVSRKSSSSHHGGRGGSGSGGKSGRGHNRPTSLIVSSSSASESSAASKLRTRTVPAPESFPTPMEEPKKVLKALFLGQIQVSKPCGMDVINEAIDNLVNEVPRHEWKMVSVAVAPSTVTINFTDGITAPTDCRVRFLSFLGIGRNDAFCAFIVHTAQDTFVAHVFQCEGSCSPLCKTIEAACKLRYQKCLDARPNLHAAAAHQRGSQSASGADGVERRSIGATLKSMFQFTSGGRAGGHP